MMTKSLAVDKSFRKRGLGRLLVEAAIARVKVLEPEQIIDVDDRRHTRL